jgi:hypothetical protein
MSQKKLNLWIKQAKSPYRCVRNLTERTLIDKKFELRNNFSNKSSEAYEDRGNLGDGIVTIFLPPQDDDLHLMFIPDGAEEYKRTW